MNNLSGLAIGREAMLQALRLHSRVTGQYWGK
jgi:hypothetical protein